MNEISERKELVSSAIRGLIKLGLAESCEKHSVTHSDHYFTDSELNKLDMTGYLDCEGYTKVSILKEAFDEMDSGCVMCELTKSGII